MTLRKINPFYAGSLRRTPSAPFVPQFARLPRAPINASPVPHLTSLYHFDKAGDYGDRSYPGNCGGTLIRDLLLYFKPRSVFDPMTGSGTCRDVCHELRIPCESTDLKRGFDGCDPAGFGDRRFDFIWSHPPYFRQKVYSNDQRDMSQCRTLAEFLQRYGQFVRNCADALAPGGKFAVLMGDYSDREEGFVPLTYYTKQLAFAAGLVQHCTDIVRFSHLQEDRND
jgi:hypothetical protein